MSETPRTALILSQDAELLAYFRTNLAALGIESQSLLTLGGLSGAANNGTRIDFVLVDSGVGESNKLRDKVMQLRQQEVAAPIVLISRESDYNTLVTATRVGIVAVVPARPQMPELLNAIKLAQQSRRLAEHEVNVHRLHRRIDTMSARERTVLHLASRGLPNKTIATRIGVSMKTVERDRRIAYGKLGVRSTAEMARQLTIVECHNLTMSCVDKELPAIGNAPVGERPRENAAIGV